MTATIHSTAPPQDVQPDDIPVVLRRIDPARRMARFYTLSIELTLFEDWACRREHGRIGSRGGRVMIGLYARRDEAKAALCAILRAKRRRGYRLVDDEPVTSR